MTKLPRSWARATISDLGPWIGGGTPSKSNEAFWNGPIPWISPKDMKSRVIWDTIDRITPEAIEQSSAKRIPPESVVIVTRSGILAHSLPVALTVFESALNQDLKAITPPDGMDAAYIAWALRAFEHRILNTCRKGGTTVQSIEMPRLSVFEIPIAPTNEQRRIVEKIETLFEEIDRGVKSLQAAKNGIVLYRQSLLKSAFEGRLTADWRAQNPDKLEKPDTLLAQIREQREARWQTALDEWEQAFADWAKGGKKGKKPSKPKRPADFAGEAYAPADELARPPTQWLLLPLSDLGQITGGLTKHQKRSTLPLKAKYLRVANVYSNRLSLDEIMEIGVTEDEMQKTRLATGDLLFVEGNGSIEQIGRVAIWDSSVPDMTHQNHLIRFGTNGLLSPRFALYFMMSPIGRKRITTQASSTSGLHTLSISKVEALSVPICSPAEQAEIARILDARLEAIELLDREIATSLARADALRQSILRKAFAGQLVLQDPDDEPASVLLERIRADRAKTPGKRQKVGVQV